MGAPATSTGARRRRAGPQEVASTAAPKSAQPSTAASVQGSGSPTPCPARRWAVRASEARTVLPPSPWLRRTSAITTAAAIR